MISPVKGKNRTWRLRFGYGVSIQMISPVKGKSPASQRCYAVEFYSPFLVSIQMISPVKGKLMTKASHRKALLVSIQMISPVKGKNKRLRRSPPKNTRVSIQMISPVKGKVSLSNPSVG
jgi:hypothetical protein